MTLFFVSLLRLLRPAQWIKNVVLFAPLFFSLWNATDTASRPPLHLLPTLLSFLGFCLLSSSVYILNDLLDAPRDRLHPRKCHRPLASRALKPRHAILLLLFLLSIVFFLSSALNAPTRLAFSAYLLLQLLYTLFLKRIPVLDVATIASGFVLRISAGGAAGSIELSPWILLCTFFLALFLALCKRRQEKAELALSAPSTRPALRHISLHTLDRLIYAVSAITLVCYAAYTQAPSTLLHFGTRGLCLTLPWVALGLARYLKLLHRHDEAERPERVLLTDLPLLLILLFFGLSVAGIFFARSILPF